jgi:hypothetical protein
MDLCHNERPCARRSFIFTPYSANGKGQLVPATPNCCASAAAGGGPCVIRLDHWRERKTGPEHPVVVMRCIPHGYAFTLYPPGFVPYGRVAVAPVDSQGQPLSQATDDFDLPDVAAQLAWQSTVFGAAQDAAQGKPWPRTDQDRTGAAGTWRSQGRRISLVASLLALTADGTSSLFVGPLGVSALSQREARQVYRAAPGYRARGGAIGIVLEQLERTGYRLLDLLLMAGFAAQLWGRAYRWEASSCQLIDVPARARSP